MDHKELADFLQGVVSGGSSEYAKKLRNTPSRQGRPEVAPKVKKPAKRLQRSSTPSVAVAPVLPDPPNNSEVSDNPLEVVYEDDEDDEHVPALPNDSFGHSDSDRRDL